jgi:hypothetical protein
MLHLPGKDEAAGNPLATPFLLAMHADNGLFGPVTAAFDGERILVTNNNGKSVSLWKAADLTALDTFAIEAGTGPLWACSDGINFWIRLTARAS